MAVIDQSTKKLSTTANLESFLANLINGDTIEYPVNKELLRVVRDVVVLTKTLN